MKQSHAKGISFGTTSGIITTLGLMIGLHSGTHSKIAIIGGIMTIAIADAFSDALGIHISEESENKHPSKEVWESTIFTFFAKFFTAITFIAPVVLLRLDIAIIINIIWGLLLLSSMSYYLGEKHGTNKLNVIAEHIFIAIVVIVIVHFVGDLIYKYFGKI